ncbi:MAG: oligosaccharide flippase family protein [Candidatus Micrarchaeia archaeon]
MGSKTANLATLIIFGQVASILFAGVAFIIVARILGPVTYGVYTLAIAVSALFGAVGDFGVGTAFNKFVSEYGAKGKNTEIKHVISDGLAMVAIMGLIFAIVTFSLSNFLAATIMHNQSYSYIIWVVSLVVFFSLIYTPSYYVLIGFGKGFYVAIIMSVQTLIQAVTAILLALYGFGALAPIIGIIVGYLIGIMLSFYFIFLKLKVKACMPSFSRMKKLLKFTLPLAISNVLGAVANNFSLMFLGAIASMAVLGYIGVATRTISLLSVLTGSIGVSIMPAFSSTITTRMKHHIGRIYNYSIYITFLLMTPIVFFIILLAKPFIITVFGGTYGGAALFTSMLSIGILISMLGSYTSTLLVSASKVRRVLKYSALIVVMEFLLIPVFVVPFKGFGFILLFYIIAPIISDILYIRAANSLLNVKIKLKKLSYIIVAGAISAIFLIPLILIFGQDYIPLLSASFVEQVLVYPAVVSILGVAKRKDLENLSELTAKVPIMGKIIEMLTRYSLMFSRN